MKRSILAMLATVIAVSLCGTAFAADVPEPTAADPSREDLAEPASWPETPYGSTLKDGVGNRQLLYLSGREDGAEPFLVAVLDYDAWVSRDQTGGAFSYDLDTGLLSVRENRDGVPAYEPMMYCLDGRDWPLERMEAEATITQSYEISIQYPVDEKEKKTCVRTVRYGGIEYVEKDGLSLDALRAVQDARHLAPGYSRLFPADWSYEARKADRKGVQVDVAGKHTVFLVEDSVDEFGREQLLDVLKATDRLRQAVLDKAERKAGN